MNSTTELYPHFCFEFENGYLQYYEKEDSSKPRPQAKGDSGKLLQQKAGDSETENGQRQILKGKDDACC